MPIDLALELKPGQSIELPAGTQQIIVANPSDQMGVLQIQIGGSLERRADIPAQARDLRVDLFADKAPVKVTNVGSVGLSVAY